MQVGDIISDKEAAYVQELEHLWDMVSDIVESGRITPADIPDDYEAITTQMAKLVGLEQRGEKADNDAESSCRPR